MGPKTNASRRRLHTPARWSSVPAWLAAVALLAVASGAAAAQKPGRPQASKAAASPRVFVGTWVATFKGTQFMTLHFTLKAGKLAGTLSKGAIDLDPEGNIAKVSVSPGTETVSIEKVEPDAVYFRRSPTSPLRCVFRLQDKTHGDLAFLDVPPDSITPKPIPLVKHAQKR